ARGCTWLITREGLIPLLELLAEQGVLPAPEVPVVESSVEVLLANFRRYLLEERGLVASTAEAYVLRARRFVAVCAPPPPIARRVLRRRYSGRPRGMRFFVGWSSAVLRGRTAFVSPVLQHGGPGNGGSVRGGAGGDWPATLIFTKGDQLE